MLSCDLKRNEEWEENSTQERVLDLSATDGSAVTEHMKPPVDEGSIPENTFGVEMNTQLVSCSNAVSSDKGNASKDIVVHNVTESKKDRDGPRSTPGTMSQWKSSFSKLCHRVKDSFDRKPFYLPHWGMSGSSCYRKIKIYGEKYAVLVGKNIEDTDYVFCVRRDNKKKLFFTPMSGGPETDCLPDIISQERALFHSVTKIIEESGTNAQLEKLYSTLERYSDDRENFSRSLQWAQPPVENPLNPTDPPSGPFAVPSSGPVSGASPLSTPVAPGLDGALCRERLFAQEEAAHTACSKSCELDGVNGEKEILSVSVPSVPCTRTQSNREESLSSSSEASKHGQILYDHSDVDSSANGEEGGEGEEKEKEKDDDKQIEYTVCQPSLTENISAHSSEPRVMQAECVRLTDEKTELSHIVHNLLNEQSQLRERYETMQSEIRARQDTFASAFTSMQHQLYAQITSERASHVHEVLQAVTESQRLREEVTHLTNALKGSQEQISQLIAIVDARDGQIHALQQTKKENTPVTCGLEVSGLGKKDVPQRRELHRGDVVDSDYDTSDTRDHVFARAHENSNSVHVELNKTGEHRERGEHRESEKSSDIDIYASRAQMRAPHQYSKVNRGRSSGIVYNEIYGNAKNKNKKDPVPDTRNGPLCAWDRWLGVNARLGNNHPYNTPTAHGHTHEGIYMHTRESNSSNTQHRRPHTPRTAKGTSPRSAFSQSAGVFDYSLAMRQKHAHSSRRASCALGSTTLMAKGLQRQRNGSEREKQMNTELRQRIEQLELRILALPPGE